jgi:hypothetical protein
MLPSNDQNINATFGNIDNISFNDGQKRNNECFGVEGEDMFQDMLPDMLEARIFGVSIPPFPNMGIRIQSSPILSPMIHPFPPKHCSTRLAHI